jgi:CubicO group peptidase (beta-lactamase class C family)
MRVFVIAFLLLCLACDFADAQPADTISLIDNLFSSWSNDTPGGAILVERGGRIFYNKAFGLADLEHNVPNRTTTIFEAGSVSKQFTATAALLLIDEGKLALDDDVRKYIPELPVYDAPIRVRHLLNHTSGLKDWGSVGAISGWPRTTRVYTQELAMQIICRQRSLNFTPGNEYSYSNSNYTLLVELVTRIAKQPLAMFTNERLFKPAGMMDTRWRDNFQEVIPGRSVAYAKRGNKFEQLMPFEHVHGHGGLLTTTADLTKWNAQLVSHAVGGDGVYRNRILKGKLNNGTSISYASGISVNQNHGTLEISHSGATAGYRAYLLAYPEKKISIAILSNDGSFSAPGAGNAIADILLGKEETKPVPSRQNIQLQQPRVDQWAGTYKSVRNFDIVTIENRNGAPYINEKPVTAIHPDTLLEEGTRWVSKRAGTLLGTWGSDTASYVKMKPVDTTPKQLQQYVGEYRSAEADCSFKVELRDGVLFLVNAPFPRLALEPRYMDGFQIEGWDLIEFRRDRKGVITGIELSTSRAERIPFSRISK